MNKGFFLCICIFLGSQTFSVYGCEEITYSYEPKDTDANSTLLCRPEYELKYSVTKKIAIWAIQNLTPAEVRDTEPRYNLFRADPDLKLGQRAELSDYVGSGYDRGHLAPAGDMSSIDGMISSFYLSNMMPQKPASNRGIWKSVEGKTRKAVLNRDRPLIIYTGPILGKEYRTIGRNKIPVPRAMFKILYDIKTNESLSLIIPNERISSQNLPKYISTIKQIEKLTGLDFFWNLKKQPKESVELW
jgi:endonuclease G